tara:strand:- start:7978 stop:8592 length:615 start_codon:yes stop_codon:yes gene_type:complete
MHELLKTQRISIAVLFFGFLLVIGLMVRKAPKSPFTMTAVEMLQKIPAYEHTSAAMAHKINNDTNAYLFIDLRSPYDYEVAHVANAKNIPTAFILDEENKTLFQRYLNENRIVILYGQSQRESEAPWLLLTQIGFTNTQVLLGGFDCYQGITNPCASEKARYDYAKISKMGALKSGQPTTAAPAKKKKAIPVKKKRKRAAEGGC